MAIQDARVSIAASDKSDEFLAEANRAAHGTWREIWSLVSHNKKWWLTPVIVVLLLVAILVILAGTSAAPLIYTLF